MHSKRTSVACVASASGGCRSKCKSGVKAETSVAPSSSVGASTCGTAPPRDVRRARDAFDAAGAERRDGAPKRDRPRHHLRGRRDADRCRRRRRGQQTVAEPGVLQERREERPRRMAAPQRRRASAARACAGRKTRGPTPCASATAATARAHADLVRSRRRSRRRPQRRQPRRPVRLQRRARGGSWRSRARCTAAIVARADASAHGRVSLRQPSVRRAGECRRVHVAEEGRRARLTLDQRGAATRDVVRAGLAPSAAPRRPEEERLQRFGSERRASGEQLVDQRRRAATKLSVVAVAQLRLQALQLLHIRDCRAGAARKRCAARSAIRGRLAKRGVNVICVKPCKHA